MDKLHWVSHDDFGTDGMWLKLEWQLTSSGAWENVCVCACMRMCACVCERERRRERREGGEEENFNGG